MMEWWRDNIDFTAWLRDIMKWCIQSAWLTELIAATIMMIKYICHQKRITWRLKGWINRSRQTDGSVVSQSLIETVEGFQVWTWGGRWIAGGEGKFAKSRSSWKSSFLRRKDTFSRHTKKPAQYQISKGLLQGLTLHGCQLDAKFRGVPFPLLTLAWQHLTGTRLLM